MGLGGAAVVSGLPALGLSLIGTSFALPEVGGPLMAHGRPKVGFLGRLGVRFGQGSSRYGWPSALPNGTGLMHLARVPRFIGRLATTSTFSCDIARRVSRSPGLIRGEGIPVA